MHAISYLLKLQIDLTVLGGHVQACPNMLKEACETYIYISQKLLSFKVDFGHQPSGKSDHFTLCIDFY